MRHLAFVLAWFVVTCTASAQVGTVGVASMARADSAFDAGDTTLARLLYAAILARDTTASRAVFRLAQLHDAPGAALALYRRYVAMEPGDAWGHMAEGDLLARIGRTNEALAAYARAHAVAPGERDVALGSARILERAGRLGEAVEALAAWTALHPGDAEAWDLQGRMHLRAGRPRAATEAFARASQLDVPGSSHRLHAARAAAALAITPEASGSVDSDGSRTWALGGSIDAMAADGVRIGAAAHRLHVNSDLTTVDGTDAGVRLDAVMPGMRLRAELGGVQYTSVSGGEDWGTARVMAQLRTWSASGGPAIELRLERGAWGYNPELIANRVVRSEGRAAVEIPLARVRVRGAARLARIEASTEGPNRRASVEGGLVLPLGSLHPAVLYRVTTFDHATASGYFAPKRVETFDAGGYWESSGDAIISFAVDVGGGVQRASAHRMPGPPAGPPGQVTPDASAWSALWRAWAQAAVSLASSRAWFVEIEAYDAAFPLDGAGAGENWRFLSIATGLRWSLR